MLGPKGTKTEMLSPEPRQKNGLERNYENQPNTMSKVYDLHDTEKRIKSKKYTAMDRI